MDCTLPIEHENHRDLRVNWKRPSKGEGVVSYVIALSRHFEENIHIHVYITYLTSSYGRRGDGWTKASMSSDVKETGWMKEGGPLIRNRGGK